MRCAVKCCVFIEIYGEFEIFSTSSAPSGHLLLKEKALVCANFKQTDKSEFGSHIHTEDSLCLEWISM